jgi:hypothetical protein
VRFHELDQGLERDVSRVRDPDIRIEVCVAQFPAEAANLDGAHFEGVEAPGPRQD